MSQRINVISESAERYTQFVSQAQVPIVGGSLELVSSGQSAALRIRTQHGYIGYPTTIDALRDALDELDGAAPPEAAPTDDAPAPTGNPDGGSESDSEALPGLRMGDQVDDA